MMRIVVLAAISMMAVATPAVAQSAAPAPKCDAVQNAFETWRTKFPKANMVGEILEGAQNGKRHRVRVINVRTTAKTTYFQVQNLATLERSWGEARLFYYPGDMAKLIKIRRIRAQGGDPCAVLRQEAAARRAQQDAIKRDRVQRICTNYMNERGRKLGISDLAGNGLAHRQSLRSACCDSPYAASLGFSNICR